MPDVSVIVSFHSERLLAATTLASLARCISDAEAAGFRCELLCVLDRIDAQTEQVVRSHAPAGSIFVESDVGDCGGARNVGIGLARGRFVAIVDGDDYYSSGWLTAAARSLHADDGRSIAHPEFIVSFGATVDFLQQIDQQDPLFSKEALLTNNFWTSTSFASRRIYLDNPYRINRSEFTGFGFEDWHWHCETVARGYRHRVIPRTAVFYRRKPAGLLAKDAGNSALIGPSSLFDLPSPARPKRKPA